MPGGWDGDVRRVGAGRVADYAARAREGGGGLGRGMRDGGGGVEVAGVAEFPVGVALEVEAWGWGRRVG